MKDPHFLLELDVELVTQRFFLFSRVVPGVSGTVSGILKDKDSKCKGSGCGGLLESQKNFHIIPQQVQLIIVRSIAGIGNFLFSYISMSVLDFYLLFFSKIRANIAQLFIGNTRVIPLASFSAGRKVVMGIKNKTKMPAF